MVIQSIQELKRIDASNRRRKEEQLFGVGFKGVEDLEYTKDTLQGRKCFIEKGKNKKLKDFLGF